MRTANFLVTIAMAAACSAPCAAQEPLSGPAARLDAQLEAMFERGELLRGVVTEQDVALLFAHLRAMLLARSTGSTPPSAEELNRRAEVIGRELKARGMLAGLLMLTALEERARQLVREAPPPPGSPPARP